MRVETTNSLEKAGLSPRRNFDGEGARHDAKILHGVVELLKSRRVAHETLVDDAVQK